MRVTRRALLSGSVAILGAPLTALSQAKMARIGVLDSWSPSTFPDRLVAFQEGVRELGYTWDQGIAMEYRSANGKVADLPRLAAELVRLQVDVIFAATTPAALAAQDATKTIPIVIAVVADPVGAKLISSLARPGGNVTGLTTGNVEIAPKRLQLLNEISGGKVIRGAMLFNPGDASNVLALRLAQDAARVLGMETSAGRRARPRGF